LTSSSLTIGRSSTFTTSMPERASDRRLKPDHIGRGMLAHYGGGGRLGVLLRARRARCHGRHARRGRRGRRSSAFHGHTSRPRRARATVTIEMAQLKAAATNCCERIEASLTR